VVAVGSRRGGVPLQAPAGHCRPAALVADSARHCPTSPFDVLRSLSGAAPRVRTAVAAQGVAASGGAEGEHTRTHLPRAHQPARGGGKKRAARGLRGWPSKGGFLEGLEVVIIVLTPAPPREVVLRRWRPLPHWWWSASSVRWWPVSSPASRERHEDGRGLMSSASAPSGAARPPCVVARVRPRHRGARRHLRRSGVGSRQPSSAHPGPGGAGGRACLSRHRRESVRWPGGRWSASGGSGGTSHRRHPRVVRGVVVVLVAVGLLTTSHSRNTAAVILLPAAVIVLLAGTLRRAARR